MPTVSLRLVIFDFDGVIADSEPAHFAAAREALAQTNVKLDWQEYCTRYMGYEDYEFMERVLTHRGRQATPSLVSTLAREKARRFARYIQNENRDIILPGVPELLSNLDHHGVHRAICSGALRSEVEAILRQAGLRRHFLEIVTADEVKAGKPDPEGYRLILARVNQRLSGSTGPVATDHRSGPGMHKPNEPEDQPVPTNSRPTTINHRPITTGECVVIEDTMWGIQAARAAGLKCLAVTTSYPAEQLHEADHVVESLAQVDVTLLERLLTGCDEKDTAKRKDGANLQQDYPA